MRLHPKASANPEATRAIREADLVVLGPGDMYTSLVPNLLVDGISAALARARATIVYVVNLMTKYGQTYNFTASDHIRTLERFIGRSIDCAIVNTAAIPKRALSVYAKYHEQPVVDDLPSRAYYAVVRAPVASPVEVSKSKSDPLVRSLIRHDSERLSQVLINIL